VHKADEVIVKLARLAPDVMPPPGRPADSGERSVFMDIYASLARFHMKTFGSTERQMAAAAAKNHRHSVHNPLSQYRKDMSTDDVLAARMISWPLTLPMCAPISDGAAAVVLASEAGLKRVARNRAVEVLASVIASGSERRPEELDKHVCRRAADRAYEIAGVAPRDISVAEVHDASAFAEILQSELLRFGEFGEGGWLAERGETSIGGRLPINPSGGLESKGHPIGATGLTQIHELVMQLRHEAGPRQVEGARLALAENGGGFQGYEEAAASIHILGRC
jgi:acetyl-CoA acetyltransferase